MVRTDSSLSRDFARHVYITDMPTYTKDTSNRRDYHVLWETAFGKCTQAVTIFDLSLKNTLSLNIQIYAHVHVRVDITMGYTEY